MPRSIFDHKIWLRSPRPDSASTGVTVRANSGSATGFEPQLNFIEGTGIDITVTDDPGTPEVDVTIASTVTTGVAVRENSGTATTARPQLNFIEGSGVELTVADDSGTPEVDITVAVPDALLLTKHLALVDHAGVASGTAAYSQFGVGTITEDGTASNLQDSTGHYKQYSQSTVAGAAGITGVAGTTRRRYSPRGSFVVKQQISEPPLRTWVGFASATLQAVDTPAGSTLHAAAFKYRSVDSANWRAYTSDGSTDTITDTGVVVTDVTRIKFGIVMDSSQVLFYIDGVLVATHTTNLPGIDTTLVSYAASTRNAGTVLFAVTRIHVISE
jgi:hypothetical protein